MKKAFEVTKMADYGKFDVRIDNSGRCYFLDSNSNPYLGSPETESAMAMILQLHGISYLELIKRLLVNTIRNWEGKRLLPFPSD